jgi:hypothetical protein
VRGFGIGVKWLFKCMKPSQGSSRPAEEFYGAQGTQPNTLIHKICTDLRFESKGGEEESLLRRETERGKKRR